ncbi:MAG: 7TM diverse intracellular signaling domain-containing protein [Clostridia bacterium]
MADNAEDFVPQVGYMTIPMFSGESGEIEIIYQYGNYVHKDGGYIQPTYLSTPQNMEQFKAANDLVSLSVSGGLLLLMLYFLLSAAVRRKTDFLCLAFCCLVMAMRDQNFFNIHLLPADTSWYLVYRVFILIVMLMPVSILLLLKCMYAKATKHWPLYAYLGMAAVAAVLICVLPTQDIVSVSTAIYYASIPYLLYLIFGIIRHYIRQRRLNAVDILVLSGFLILLAGLLYEALLTGDSFEVTHYGAAAYGMLGFVFLNAAAINLADSGTGSGADRKPQPGRDAGAHEPSQYGFPP